MPGVYRALDTSELYTSTVVRPFHLCEVLDEVGRAQVPHV